MRSISTSHPFPHSFTESLTRLTNSLTRVTLRVQWWFWLALILFNAPHFSPHLLIPPQEKGAILGLQAQSIMPSLLTSHLLLPSRHSFPSIPHPSLSPQPANLPPQPPRLKIKEKGPSSSLQTWSLIPSLLTPQPLLPSSPDTHSAFTLSWMCTFASRLS